MLLGHQIPMGFMNIVMNFSPTSVCSLKQMQLWKKIAAASSQADLSEKKNKTQRKLTMHSLIATTFNLSVKISHGRRSFSESKTSCGNSSGRQGEVFWLQKILQAWLCQPNTNSGWLRPWFPFIQTTEVWWLAKKELVSESPLVGRNCQIKVLGTGFWGQGVGLVSVPFFPKGRKQRSTTLNVGTPFLLKKIFLKN